jgi:hypothetical protein
MTMMKDADILVFDHTATVTIDDCKRCRVFLAPSKGRSAWLPFCYSS